MSGFDRLTPALQYQIANTLGFTSLRPVQDLSIPPILDGKNAVILAPTAGGKTEAAFFPLLSAMDAGGWRPVSVIYLSPIRALLNNQEHRLSKYAATIGRRATKWHGDTPQGERKDFVREPADLLLTTPESLEAMLMSPRVPAATLFNALQAVVIDEVHAFADDDRGAHLAAVLERLSRHARRDVQRIGLSATVGNPSEILRWVQGSSTREGVVISPPKPPMQPEIVIDHVGSSENAAAVVEALHPGKKRLVFLDSRRGVEELGRALIAKGVNAFVTHGSLGIGERTDAERAFMDGTDCVIVATSALELGIDVGDLDHVLQIDAPGRVASFLQRMGRTGRRAGTITNCTFLTTKPWMLLQAAALVRLYEQGYVEDVKPSRRAAHVLAHQILALSLQTGGLGKSDWFQWVRGATTFADLTEADREALVAHMLAGAILSEDGGKLWLGQEGEKLYGRRNFAELYAVFSTPRILTVRHNAHDVGTLDAAFLQSYGSDDEPASFTLGGRAWQVVDIDWKRGVCVVQPAPQGRAARWQGAPRFLGYELCRAMQDLLTTDEASPRWSRRATELITSLRAEHAFLRDEPCPMVSSPNAITIWTFAGGAANVLLARMIETELGGKCVVRNVSITCSGTAGESVAALRLMFRAWHGAGRPNEADALAFAERCAGKARVSKFTPCLTEGLTAELLAERVTDAEGARRAVRMACQDIERPSSSA